MTVSTNRGPATPQGRGEQELLVLLALRAGRVVATEQLIDALWGEALPANPINALQLRVSKLRKALTAAADIGDLVATHARGYSLEIRPADVDARRFMDAVTEARVCRKTHDLHGAVAHYRRADAEWQGRALLEFLHTGWAPAEAQLWENLRLAAQEERLTVELHLGQHADVLAEIQAAVQEHPLRERLHGLHMTALYRCGQQADALAAFQKARDVLSAELGLEPSPELQALERAILQHDPALLTPTTGLGRTSERHRPSPKVRKAAAPDAGFVGRRRELSDLQGAAARAQRKVAQVVLLTGEAGIGKSTLCHQLGRTSGLRELVGRCTQLGGDCLPLAPVADLLRTVARLPTGRDQLADPAVRPLATLAPSVVAPGAGPVSPASSAEVFDAFLVLLRRLGDTEPTIVVLEDLHWTDRSTWDLLAFIARCVTDERVVVVATFRLSEAAADAHVRRLVAELTRLEHVSRLHLTGLDPADVAIQVQNVLGRAVPDPVLDELVQRSAGNPFFVEQLAVAAESGEALPSLVGDLLGVEIDALPAATQQLLELVAVCGRSVVHGLLGAILDHDEENLDAALRAALDARILVASPVDETYAFRHALFGDVIEMRMLPATRTRHHGRVARALEQAPGWGIASPGGIWGELAHHWERAGSPDKALRSALAAADAMGTIAPAAGLHHLEQALRLDGLVDENAQLTVDERRTRQWQLAELAFIVGDGDKAVAWARTALESDTVTAGRMERLARYLWTAGDTPASATAYERALELIDANTPTLEAAAVHAGTAQGTYLTCRFADTVEHAETALRLSDGVQSPDADHVRVRARSVLGSALAVMGHTERGIAESRAAVDLAMSTVDAERYVTHVYLAEALSIAGRDAEVVDLLRPAIEEARRLGLERSYGGYCIAMAVESLTRLGRFRQATELLDSYTARDAVPVTHHRLVAADALLAARLGRHDRARLLVSTLEGITTDDYHRRLSEHVATETALAAGDHDVALSLARQGWADCGVDDRRSPARYARLIVQALACLSRTADVPAGSVDPDLLAEATRVVEEAHLRSQTDGSDTTTVEAAAHLADARAHLTLLAGTPRPGVWAAAASAWAAAGMSWHQAIAHRREAEAAAALGDREQARGAISRADTVALSLEGGDSSTQRGAGEQDDVTSLAEALVLP